MLLQEEVYWMGPVDDELARSSCANADSGRALQLLCYPLLDRTDF